MRKNEKQIQKLLTNLVAGLPLNPFPTVRNRGCYIHLGLLDRVDELYIAGKKAYASVRIGAFCSVFEISLDGTAHVSKLAANLMMSPCEELYFQKEIAVSGLD